MKSTEVLCKRLSRKARKVNKSNPTGTRSPIVGDHAAAGASCHPTPVHRSNSAIHESKEAEALQMMRARVLYFKRGSNTKESGSLNRI
jgi:hypothetical protein